jgi:S-adenosylmethionine hydrolase
MTASLIALVSDFGRNDWYVGVMKGVVLTLNPAARIVDLTHSVPAHDAPACSFALLATRTYLPAGAVVAAVVDPGVGGSRRVLAARSAGRFFLAPDNGVLTEVLEADGCERMVSVENRDLFLKEVSRTFHGRDIFAPVAARLSLGMDIGRLGPETADYMKLELPAALRGPGSLAVTVRWVDSFGNLITGVTGEMLAGAIAEWGAAVVDVGTAAGIPIVESYQSVAAGDALALLGSSDRLEISVREGSAAARLGADVGSVVVLRKT